MEQKAAGATRAVRGAEVEVGQASREEQRHFAADRVRIPEHDAAVRAELIADDAGIGAFVQQFPATDTQQLRSLVRSARKDAALAPEQRSGRAFRELFQFIKQVRDDHE